MLNLFVLFGKQNAKIVAKVVGSGGMMAKGADEENAAE